MIAPGVIAGRGRGTGSAAQGAAVGLLLVAGAILPGCGGSPPPDLLVIVSDAFRADALDCGREESRTPNLCRLAASGVTFERAYSAAPWTLPSAVAMVTGNSPSQYHLTGEERERAEQPRNWVYRIPEGERPFGELLVAAGYRVEGAVENPVVARSGALRGFTRRSHGDRRKQSLLRRLDPRLGFNPRDDRYLEILWALDLLLEPPEGPLALLHWIDDPHAEYRPPAALLEREPLPRLPREIDFYRGLGHHHSPRRGLHKLRRQVATLTPEELAFVRRLYLLEVESVDERVGYLLRALELSGRAERTLVVFTSDHGEGFGEHGDFLHGVSLYDEMVRVPMIVSGPGVAAGHRVATPVSHLDLAPTLADLMGIDGLGEVQGASLRDLLAGGDHAPPRPLYLSSPDRLDRDAVVFGRHKLIADHDGGPRSDEADRLELYDLVADPGETINLAAELPEVLRDLEARLLRARQGNERLRRARVAAETPEALDQSVEETLRTLRSVGYID